MRYYLLSLLIGWSMLGQAQPLVQVVTKVVEKELPYTEGQRVRLNAQKADVTLKGWNRSVVSVKLRLVAKHADKAVAEREVDYHRYVMQVEKGQIELANSFDLPKPARKLQSQLKAIYEVSLPTKALLTLTNSFGDIRLSDLTGETSVKFEFGKLTLENMSGKLAITSEYGDIDGHNLDATLTGKVEKADVVLRNLSGSVNLQSRYGKLTVLPTPALSALKIEAARTEILVVTKRLVDFRFDVITSYADIRVPESLTEQLSKYAGKQVLSYQPPGRKPEISIQNSYSPVTIQGDKPLVNR